MSFKAFVFVALCVAVAQAGLSGSLISSETADVCFLDDWAGLAGQFGGIDEEVKAIKKGGVTMFRHDFDKLNKDKTLQEGSTAFGFNQFKKFVCSAKNKAVHISAHGALVNTDHSIKQEGTVADTTSYCEENSCTVSSLNGAIQYGGEGAEYIIDPAKVGELGCTAESVQNKLVVLSVCVAGATDALAQAWLDAGFKAVIAHNDVIGGGGAFGCDSKELCASKFSGKFYEEWKKEDLAVDKITDAFTATINSSKVFKQYALLFVKGSSGTVKTGTNQSG